MAERIEGFTIGIDLDTLRVERGLSGLKDRLRTVNSEMRKNMSSFDYGEKSLDKYQSKMDGLNKKLEVQKQITAEAKKEYEKMVDEHGRGSKEAERAERAYNNQAASLNNLERYISKANQEMHQFAREQQVQSTRIYKTGDAMESFGNRLGEVSSKARETGSTLTKRITLPALGVVSAIGGITAAFGWKRLTGLDSAQAQLKGLGYNTEEVGRISDQVTEAIEGGMTTMAEGTSVAAGAMAAGVKEGKDLKRYIKLVGDAAVGANRPVGDMAQIFNRVQGSGKLMTQELNMIEDGMPGFALAMAKHLDVPLDKFREMVTAGEVDSKQFLDVMEDFAGGMAGAYADSWQGMVANTKAYIGIIGENLLKGVFEKSKDSIREFIDILKSPAVQEWAAETGEKIGNAFTKVVDAIKSGIKWYLELDSKYQKLIGATAGFVVALGPLLTGFGILGGMIAKLSGGLGMFLKVLAPIVTPMKALGSAAVGSSTGFGLLRGAFVALTGPIGLTVGIIGALVTGFIVAYKKSEKFREIVAKIKDAFFNAVEGIKEFLTTNETLLSAVDSIKNGFNIMKDNVKLAIGAVVSYFSEKVTQMKDFWNAEGQSILEATQNVFKAIWFVIEPIIKAIVSIVKISLPIIKGIFKVTFKAILLIVKTVWGNIKGVIDGALQVITGLIKLFSSVFTGNWSGMWEGIKTILSGAVKFVWNFIQLSFFGRILKAGKLFASGLKSVMSGMWNGIRTIFTNIIKSIGNFVKNSFNGIKNNISRTLEGIKTLSSRVWNGIKNVTIKPISNLVSTAKTKFNGFKTSVSNIFSGIRDTVSERVSSMVKTVTGMPGRMKKGIVDGASKVKDGFKAVSNKMVEGIGSGVNGVIGGVNWAWHKLGGKKNKFGKWKVPKYAHGTDGHPGGLAQVNDGKGYNAGQELIKLPDGTTGMFKGKNVVANLPKGTQVLSAKQTKEIIPQYALGIGKKFKNAYKKTKGGIKKGAKATASGVKKGAKWSKDKVMDGFDWAKGKAKDGAKYLFNKGLDALGVNTKYGKSFAADFGVRGLKTLTKRAIRKLTGKAKEYKDTEAVPNVSGGVKSWIGQIKKASTFMNAQASGKEIGGILKQIQRESGGNQGITQSSSVVDINTLSGNPAKGLLQYIPQTFRAYAMKGYGNIMNGYHQLLAFFNNSNWRRDLPYGKRGWGPTGRRRFASGGLINNHGLYELAEGGYPEWVIPTDPSRRTEAMKLLALAGKDVGNNKRPNQLPNVSNQNDALLQATIEQNNILTQILQKDTSVNIDRDALTDVINDRNALKTLGTYF